MSPNEYLEKLRSIGVPRRMGMPEERVRREKDSTVIETEHWSGRQDATVTPATIRHGARVHKTGRKRGEIAEVRKLSTKESKERYGNGEASNG